ncbi:reverse transcriptase domain-containing protein [Tanacetum coccineum]
MLQAPTEGYEDAIVIPKINANFELKHGLINLVQNKQFFGHDKEDPHAHIQPPRSIFTWDDLVSKFINQFFPPSKTTNLRNEITRFQQRFDESFYEAWDRFNDLLRACPHHGFYELHQLDTFYNALNANDQDSLNSAAGGNFLDKMPRECLRIIKSKSKVSNSRNKAVVAKVSSNSSTPGISPDVAALTTEEAMNLSYAEKSEKSKNKQFAHAISIIDFSKDEPFSGSTTNHSDTLPPSSSPVKTSEILEEFADELTLLKKDVHF